MLLVLSLRRFHPRSNGHQPPWSRTVVLDVKKRHGSQTYQIEIRGPLQCLLSGRAFCTSTIRIPS